MFKTGSLLQFTGGRTKFLKCLSERQNGISFSKCQVLNSQPTPQSHPHLLKPGEISPRLQSCVYTRRRAELMKKIRSASHESSIPQLVLVPSTTVVYMSENIPYPFRQQTDFYYLSGSKEPDSALFLSTNVSNREESFLFVPRSSPTSERWEGKKMSLKDSADFFRLDQTCYLEDLEKHLQSFAKTGKKFKLWHDVSNSGSAAVQKIVCSFIEACRGFVVVESFSSLVQKCRIIKSPEEVELMRETCRIGAESLKEVIKFSRLHKLEAHLEAKMEYECRVMGAERASFPPVVAGGARANTIHYIDNNQTLNVGDLVLMDAGCEYNGYCSDLARTWPVSGKFTDPQKALYNLVLSVQERLISMTAEKPPLDFLFRRMCEELGAGLQALEIIPKNLTKENVAQAAFSFCPHHVSHYLGMDVHDTSTVSRSIRLLPGMVVTVEPGVYISQNDTNVPEQFRGICIRIEDDILITEKGFENLTASCPKHADDIEKLLN